ncbi:unnamed protein product [Dibothriocephalus latus]|uniref:Uncharacterized protein n=1 Tax=Dibothriocephalus latus TaxID=60516 RepID=A0A3P7LN79_DIBLA|nr:unnamed protein product [Dibothriocephalus latus]
MHTMQNIVTSLYMCCTFFIESAKAYKDHGFRMMSIWLHGVEADPNAMEQLQAALVAIGKKERADKLQHDYHKVLHGHKNWKQKLEVPTHRKRR